MGRPYLTRTNREVEEDRWTLPLGVVGFPSPVRKSPTSVTEIKMSH